MVAVGCIQIFAARGMLALMASPLERCFLQLLSAVISFCHHSLRPHQSCPSTRVRRSWQDGPVWSCSCSSSLDSPYRRVQTCRGLSPANQRQGPGDHVMQPVLDLIAYSLVQTMRVVLTCWNELGLNRHERKKRVNCMRAESSAPYAVWYWQLQGMLLEPLCILYAGLICIITIHSHCIMHSTSGFFEIDKTTYIYACIYLGNLFFHGKVFCPANFTLV